MGESARAWPGAVAWLARPLLSKHSPNPVMLKAREGGVPDVLACGRREWVSSLDVANAHRIWDDLLV